MRLSRAFFPTLKEAPSDAEVVSHKLMVRSGMIRRVAAGVYSLLPLGVRAQRKVEQICREELTRAGAQEVFLPALNPAELWQRTGRWDVYGKELIRLQDRHGREFCLGPTHEEIITDLVAREVRSYRDLPQTLFQIQTKFRDEIRPRFGVMRGREFTMKDGYSFDRDEQGAEESYAQMVEGRSVAKVTAKFRDRRQKMLEKEVFLNTFAQSKHIAVVQRGYEQSLMAVGYLHRIGSKRQFRAFLSLVGRGVDSDAALRQVYRFDVDTLLKRAALRR